MVGSANKDQRGDDFSTLFEFLPIGAYRSSPEGRQLRANPALVRLSGYASERELVDSVQDIGAQWYVDPQRRLEFKALLEHEGQVLGFESEVFQYKTRERLWVSENAHAVRDASGRLLYYEGTVEEITARVHAEQAARTRETLLQQILNLMPGVVYRIVYLPDGVRRTTFASQGTRELFGVEPEVMLAESGSWVRLRHPDDRARVRLEIDRALAAFDSLSVETRLLLPDGTIKWAQIVGTPAPDEDGHPVRVGMMFDITARKLAEQALLDNSELWKRALVSSGDGVWDWDLELGQESLSPQIKALYGYADDELADDPSVLDAMTHPDDMAAMLQARADHMAGRTATYSNEHRVRCKDGQWKWILTRGIVLSRDASGRPLRMIGTHTDITAHKQAEALRVERDRAAAADLAKSQFLSRVSHELRTPLNAILGFAQLLEMELQPSAGERLLGWNRQVLASGRHLLALVDDILDLSSMQTGHLSVKLERLSLRPVVEEAWTMLAATAAAQQVALIDELPADESGQLVADRTRLKQIVSNLLSNAIKYNHPGGWVRVSALTDQQGLELRVADSGQGLDAAQLARLFNPFERLGAERSPVTGTGLGLALTRQLVEAMGGSITAHSAIGQGATFVVRLPLA